MVSGTKKVYSLNLGRFQGGNSTADTPSERPVLIIGILEYRGGDFKEALADALKRKKVAELFSVIVNNYDAKNVRIAEEFVKNDCTQ